MVLCRIGPDQSSGVTISETVFCFAYFQDLWIVEREEIKSHSKYLWYAALSTEPRVFLSTRPKSIKATTQHSLTLLYEQ